MVEINFELVIEIKPIHVAAGGEEWIEDAMDRVYGDTGVWGEGQESGLDYFYIYCTVALNVNVLTRVIYFSSKRWESSILDDFVHLYVLVHCTIKLPSHWVHFEWCQVRSI